MTHSPTCSMLLTAAKKLVVAAAASLICCAVAVAAALVGLSASCAPPACASARCGREGAGSRPEVLGVRLSVFCFGRLQCVIEYERGDAVQFQGVLLLVSPARPP